MSGFTDDLARWLTDAGFRDESEADDRTEFVGDDPWGEVDIPLAHLSSAQLEQLEQSTRWLADVDDLEAGGASAAPPLFVDPGERLGD